MPAKAKRAARTSTRPRNSLRQVDRKFAAAMRKGDLKAAQRALDDGADINAPIEFATALIQALEDANDEIIEWLLAQPAIDINQVGKYDSALSAAVLGASISKSDRWVERLFELGADCTFVNGFGHSALTRCVQYFGDRTVWLERFMVPATVTPKGALLRWRPINLALEADAVVAFRMLLERGGQLDNPVEAAAKAGAVEIVASIIEHGHAIGAALGEAKSRAAIELLLDAGADIEARGANGASALDSACRSSDLERARLLIERGARLDGVHAFGQPLVFALAVPPDIEIAELLRAHGADLTARDRDGKNAADDCRALAEDCGVPSVARELKAMIKWLAAHGVTESASPKTSRSSR